MNLETMQREGREKYVKYSPEIGDYIDNFEAVDLDQHTANVWMAAQESIKKSILESGLLEEVIPVGDEIVDNPEKERVNREIAGHNTLASNIKAHLDELINAK